MVIPAFIGYDTRERDAFEVCRRSMVARSSTPVHAQALRRHALQASGLYRRYMYSEGGQYFDRHTNDAMSTEFTFTRYLVPALCQWGDWALFCDSDFLWRGDVRELWEMRDSRYAVMVVKHDHQPDETVKMRGQVQTRYERKNWSSLILWNCAHRANQMLTPYRVNMSDKGWLHGFRWLEDAEIGALSLEWNWLEGYSDPAIQPKAVHFTRGTPDMPGHAAAAFCTEWRSWL